MGRKPKSENKEANKAVNTTAESADQSQNENENRRPTRTRNKPAVSFVELSTSEDEEDEKIRGKKSKSSAKKKAPLKRKSSKKWSDDDEDFKLSDESAAAAESDDDESIKSDELAAEDQSNSISSDDEENERTKKKNKMNERLEKIAKKMKYKYNYKYKKKPLKKIENDESVTDLPMGDAAADQAELNEFDMNLKIDEWKYEIDPETSVFRRPILPLLSDQALKPFVSSKSRAKSQIFECPHCHKPFTYTLVFKSHLYSCIANANVPKYVLYCASYPKCQFKGQRRQEMINHFAAYHSKERIGDDGTADQSMRDDDEANSMDTNMSNLSLNSVDLPLTDTKKNQLEVCHYFSVDKKELQFTRDLYNNFFSKCYKRLKYLDNYFKSLNDSVNKLPDDHQLVVELASCSSSSLLRFQYAKSSSSELTFEVKPFELYEKNQLNESAANSSNLKEATFKIFNAGSHVTAMDWCLTKSDEKNKSNHQYLAFATLPTIKQEGKEGYEKQDDSLRPLLVMPNLIYFLKFNDLNSNWRKPTESNVFAYLNETIGRIYYLKFRPDYAASYSAEDKDAFIGYLLATSSNGCAYIYYARDHLTAASGKSSSSSSKSLVDVFKTKQLVTLKTTFTFGQCTAGDWSQLNGSTQVSLGFANGSIALFDLNSKCLSNQQTTTAVNGQELIVYPLRTFLAHDTCVRAIRWSKLNPNLLATGSLFSREIKVWNLNDTDRALMNYETYCTDMEFSLHSNDLFITKEINLKGENHLNGLEIAYNVSSYDKDESRAHSSLFYTYSTMTSLSMSDYLNKMLICDADGSIIITKGNDSKYWLAKNKLMSYSFAHIIKFAVQTTTDDLEEETTATTANTNAIKSNQIDTIINKSYDLSRLNSKKSTRTILIDPKQRQAPSKPKNTLNSMNSVSVDLNSCTQIRWNKNLECLNWYAVSSMSGFIFIHKLNDLRI